MKILSGHSGPKILAGMLRIAPALTLRRAHGEQNLKRTLLEWAVHPGNTVKAEATDGASRPSNMQQHWQSQAKAWRQPGQKHKASAR